MSTTIAASLTVLIGMFVLGLSIGLGTWVLSWSDHLKKQLLVEAYFCTNGTEGCSRDATPKQIQRVRTFLVKEKQTGRVKRFTFISRERALELGRKRFPKETSILAFNPFPASFKVIPTKAEYNAGIKGDILHLGPGGTKPVGLDRVRDGGETSRQVLRVGGILELVFLVGLIVLLVASTLLIANTIRLSIFARRREIEVMKLVGATNWFVRGPFMIEGLICGIAGSLAAVILLLIGKEVVLPAILGHIEGSRDVHALTFELQALAILVAGLLLGAAGSGLTLRRFLRV
jgi:cell division transport system permease protein